MHKNTHAPAAQLRQLVKNLRSSAVAELGKIGYSAKEIQRMAAGVGPFPASITEAETYRDPRTRAERKAFFLVESLMRLRELEGALKSEDAALAALCMYSATGARHRAIALEQRLAGRGVQPKRKRAEAELRKCATETMRRLRGTADEPQKVEALRLSLPETHRSMRAPSSFARLVKKWGGMENL